MTSMVFSSMHWIASSGFITQEVTRLTGIMRASTSQYPANFSSATCAFALNTIFGWHWSFPGRFCRSCQRFISASPASITASDEPAVAVPTAVVSAVGAFQRCASTDTHRLWMIVAAGYSPGSHVLVHCRRLVVQPHAVVGHTCVHEEREVDSRRFAVERGLVMLVRSLEGDAVEGERECVLRRGGGVFVARPGLLEHIPLVGNLGIAVPPAG